MGEEAYDLDATRTPDALFNALHRKHAFAIDLFADSGNAKALTYFHRQTDAFAQEWPRLTEQAPHTGQWGTFGWCWANPPYGRGYLPRFVAKAREQVKRGSAIVSLIPATPGTEWFNDGILRRCDTLEGFTVDEPEFYPNGTKVISGYCLSQQGIGYRQTVTFLKGRVPFDPPIGYPPEKEWNPPATDSILWTLRPPLR